MERRLFWLLAALLVVLLAACGGQSQTDTATGADGSPETRPVVTVFKSPSCGCCGAWINHMEANGFMVEAENVADPVAVKQERSVPQELYSCHTAVVDGYTIEGHVPAAEIERLLAERPDIAGLAVAGMPIGSPGMETEGVANQPYDVIAFDEAGNMEVYASYGP